MYSASMDRGPPYPNREPPSRGYRKPIRGERLSSPDHESFGLGGHERTERPERPSFVGVVDLRAQGLAQHRRVQAPVLDPMGDREPDEISANGHASWRFSVGALVPGLEGIAW